MIYCTRKVRKAKFYSHKEITYRAMKSYTKEKFVDMLSQKYFPDYSDFTDVNEAYSDFIGRLSSVINVLAPVKKVRVKQGSPDWLDGEVLVKIGIRDKLLKKFRKSKLQIDKNLYHEARDTVQKLVKSKKNVFITRNNSKTTLVSPESFGRH